MAFSNESRNARNCLIAMGEHPCECSQCLELHEYSVPSHPCDQEPDRQMKPFPRLERPEFAAGSGAVLMLQGVFHHTALVAPGQKETSPPKLSGHRWPQMKLNGNVGSNLLSFRCFDGRKDEAGQVSSTAGIRASVRS